MALAGRLAGPALVLALVVAMLPAFGQEQAWLRFGVVPTSAVFYDYDNDGVVEVVLPGAVIEGKALIPSPYPPLPFVAKADLTGDGILDLVLYGNGELHIYDGTRLVAAFQVPDVEPVKAKHAFAFGNVIVWRGGLYTIGGVAGVVPVADRDSLYALYHRDGYLRLLNVLTGDEVGIYKDLVPAGGARVGGTFYVAARYQDGSLAVVRYEAGRPPQVGAYTVNLEAVLGFNHEAEAFYVKADGRLYLASATHLLLLSDWEPVSADEDYIYLWKGGTVAVFSPGKGGVVATVRLPAGGKPSLVAGYPRLVAVIPGDGTYVLHGWTQISITFYGERSVMAGEPYRFGVEVSPKSVAYTVLVDGLPAPPGTREVVFTKVGLHNITVQASDGVVTVERTYTILVYPRPLTVSLQVVKPPAAHSPMEVAVLALDRGRQVALPVNITLPDGTVVAGRTGEPIVVPVGAPESPYYRVAVAVWGDMYGVVAQQFDIPVVQASVEPVVSYLGNGTFRVDIVSQAGVPVEGRLSLYLGGRAVYSGAVPGVVRLEPGNYTLTVEFQPQNRAAFRSLRTTITVSYLGERATVPEVAGAVVVAVDRVVNETKVVTVTEVVTETVTEAVVKEKEVPRKALDTFEAVLFHLVGLAAGAAVGTALGVEAHRRGLLPPRRWRKGRESVEAGAGVDELFEEA